MSFLAVLIRTLVMLIFYLIPDIFITSGLKAAFPVRKKRAVKIYWIINLILLVAGVSVLFLSRSINGSIIRINSYLFGTFISFTFAKIITAIVLLGEDIIRIPYSIYKRMRTKEKHDKKQFLVSRRKFIANSAFIIGAIPFTGFMYGMFKGRYDFKIRKETVYFDDLPGAFNGVTITQISDLHIGSFDKFAKHILEGLAEKIQSLNSDLLFFTGDIVNSRSNEMDGWYDVFNKFTAPLGKFSVLGNHDYGDYVTWPTDIAKEENLGNVKVIHTQLGFKLLLNEHIAVERNNEKLFIVGVENWGKGDFPKFGDIKKATEGLNEKDFKILLSHDPSHWDEKVLKETYAPQITLSGHTHGFQMGIETPAFRFSPSQWIYKQWAGLYKAGNHYLYVNRGLGTVGYPGRIGIWPEITQLTLKRNKS